MNANVKNNAADLDLGGDLRVRATRRGRERVGVAGEWATGTVAGHRFEALVFPEHAANPNYEVGGDSRISKLWVERLADRKTVYNWDRGLDIPAADATAAAIVEFLAAGLAEHAFPDRAVKPPPDDDQRQRAVNK